VDEFSDQLSNAAPVISNVTPVMLKMQTVETTLAGQSQPPKQK
jgi:hypothetical protein